MNLKIEGAARTLKPSDIDYIEKELQISLPDNYKAFLLMHNGGIPSPDAFPIQGMKDNPVGGIQVMFGIDQHIESSNLGWNYRTFQGRLPTNLFPIACTGSGDLICLVLWGDDAGAVVFWDSCAETEPPTYQNVYRVADNFNAFIASIHQD